VRGGHRHHDGEVADLEITRPVDRGERDHGGVGGDPFGDLA
jgi:hypothetical protein